MPLQGLPQNPPFPGLSQSLLNSLARANQPIRTRSETEVTGQEPFDFSQLPMLIYFLLNMLGGGEGGTTRPGMPVTPGQQGINIYDLFPLPASVPPIT